MSYIIAEIGNNHEGDISWAKQAISEAKLCGADAVKFQAINPSSLVNATVRQDRVKALERLCLPPQAFSELFSFAKNQKIDFGVSFFDAETCQMLPSFDFAKIASSDCDNLKLLEAVSSKYNKIFISTGTLSSEGIENLKNFVNSSSADITVLHCISKYPTPISDASLGFITVLKNHFEKVGYSDHTDSLEVNLMALALGANVFEKHFTLDKNLTGIKDHLLSSNPLEFEIFCKSIRKFYSSLGTYDFNTRPEFSDDSYYEIKQSYYLKNDVLAGDIITADDFDYQRPRVSNSFLRFKLNETARARRNLRANEPLRIDDVLLT